MAAADEGRSSSVVVRGEPGVGKSALLSYAAGSAGSAVVLRATGVPAESEFAFAGLHELLRPVLDRLDEIPEVQAAALRGALAMAEPAGAGRLYVGAATLSLVAAAADDKGLVCLIDDAQWLDKPSADALTFAARRLEAEGVVMLFACDDGGAATFEGTGLEELRLTGLGAEDALELLRRSAPSMPERVAADIVRAVGGNTRTLIELPTLLREAQVAGREPLPHPLPVGDALAAQLRARAAVLSDAGREAMLAAAVCDTVSMRVLARAPTVDEDALAECEEAGFLTLDGGRYDFVDPLLRNAVYTAATPEERRESHRAIAEALGDDPRYAERRAWHLAAATIGPDDDVASMLERAGQAAAGRRAHLSATAMFEWSARFTVEAELRAARLLHAAWSAWLAASIDQAYELAEDALHALVSPADRADAALLQAKIDLARGAPAGPVVTRLVSAADEIASIDTSRACELLATASLASDPTHALGIADRAIDLAAEDHPRGRLLAHLALGRARALRAPTRGSSAFRDVRALLESDMDLHRDPEVLVQIVDALGDVEIADLDIDELLRTSEEAAREHALVVLPRVLVHAAWRRFAGGDWQRATVDALEAARLFDETGQRGRAPTAEALLAFLDATTGREGSCNDRLARLRQMSLPADVLERSERRIRGQQALGAGDAVEAVRQLEPLAAGDATLIPGRSVLLVGLIDALVRCGRVDTAEEMATLLERASGIEGVCQAWARGLLEPSSAAGFGLALQRLDALADDRPFLRGRIHLSVGERQRRDGQRVRAREELGVALRLFESLGADPWAKRTRDELGISPPKLGPRDDLTPQELQVAELIADGATYKDAAARLFLTPKTIEFHLGKVYRKLQIAGRRELPKALERYRSRSVEVVSEPRSDRARRTFMFTDIVRSTELAEAIGDRAWHNLRRWHDEALRRRFAEFRGQEVDTTGDGFFVAFHDAGDAIRCAIEIMRDLDRHRREHGFAPEIRIGVHAAEADQADGTFIGVGVHAASRISGLAGAGEIVVSEQTLPPSAGVSTVRPRTVQLKGIAEPMTVTTVGWR
jgi:class 3 adenylate cyclase